MIDLKQVPVGTITLKIEGISKDQTERYHQTIRILILCGGLDNKAGKTILHWDKDGLLRGVEKEGFLWRAVDK